jgi:hypothetical protein
MTVSEYVKKQRELLKRFETWWIEQSMIDPDSESFPPDMHQVDWDEQFCFFPESIDSDDIDDPDIDPDGDVYGYMRQE